MSRVVMQGTSKEGTVHGDHRGGKGTAGEWVTACWSWLSTHTQQGNLALAQIG